MKKLMIILNLFVFLLSGTVKGQTSTSSIHNLDFKELATTWDEAIPLGNGMIGNLVWQNNGKLRFSLDRGDLWDLRPMENIDFDEWKFQDVYEHWKKDQYGEVQKVFDVPYDALPAPSKIPGGALEFDIDALGKVKSVILDVETAICIVEWESGAKLTTFVHAQKPIGWYKFENIPKSLNISLIPPAYQTKGNREVADQSMGDLDQLGYEQGTVEKNGNSYTYNQKGWGDFSYQIYTQWNKTKNGIIGSWSISSAKKSWEARPRASEVVSAEIKHGFATSYNEHVNWWKKYWKRSGIEIPDPLLEKQYYLEMYKFGAAARSDAPPIALQSVWTADNGKLPPWKGDYHHDLNTQLSYWPAYTGNHLDLEEGFLNWLWKHRSNFKKYTRDYFEVDGLNVPGVTTLEGEPMGGWIQYSMGQTVSAWLGHHFYLHWQYSMDREFLEQKAYPWIKDVAVFLDEVSINKDDGQRKLLMSSSPEIYNNSREAWFAQTTNFDLALIRWTYKKAAEMALELGKKQEAIKWSKILSEWPELAVDEKTGFKFAPDLPYKESHRHFSHLMGYHPLGLVDFSDGESEKKIIENTLNNLEEIGSQAWTGYSFSWLGNLYARAFKGDKAAEVLRIFAKCFTLKNSFHVNGDQCKAGHSGFTYRPFTLEGNFAFASAIQEMLIQSHTEVIKLFPAIPEEWKDAKFEKLRTRGAFLVSARMENGFVKEVEVIAEKGGQLILENPFKNQDFKSGKEYLLDGKNLILEMQPNERVKLITP